MKNLNALKGAKCLNKSEMGKITGGTQYSCACNDGSARWQGTYKDSDRAANRAAYWCGEGGGRCA